MLKNVTDLRESDRFLDSELGLDVLTATGPARHSAWTGTLRLSVVTPWGTTETVEYVADEYVEIVETTNEKSAS